MAMRRHSSTERTCGVAGPEGGVSSATPGYSAAAALSAASKRRTGAEVIGSSITFVQADQRAAGRVALVKPVGRFHGKIRGVSSLSGSYRTRTKTPVCRATKARLADQPFPGGRLRW